MDSPQNRGDILSCDRHICSPMKFRICVRIAFKHTRSTMGLTPGNRHVAFRVIISLTIAAWILGATLRVGRSVHAGQAGPNPARTVQLGEARPGSLYAITVAVKDPAQVQGNDAVPVTINDAQGEVESK